MAIGRQNRKAVILLLFLAVVFSVAYFVYQRYNGSLSGVTANGWFGDRVSRADYLALQAENTLLKKMLGQIAGQVIVLGPSSDKVASPVGKIVWDKATQGGYLYASGLPDAAANYSLWMQDENGQRYYCGVFSLNSSGEIQSAFQPSKPVFKPKLFFIAKGPTIDTVVLRGSL